MYNDRLRSAHVVRFVVYGGQYRRGEELPTVPHCVVIRIFRGFTNVDSTSQKERWAFRGCVTQRTKWGKEGGTPTIRQGQRNKKREMGREGERRTGRMERVRKKGRRRREEKRE